MEIGEKIARSRQMGASDDEIIKVASESDPSFAEKYAKSIEMGAKPKEILDHLAAQQPQEQSFGQKAKGVATDVARVGMQAALGGIEGSPLGMAYDIGATATNLLRKGSRYVGKKLGVPEPEGFEPFEVPTIGEAAEAVGKKIGVDTKPQSVFEHGARLSGQVRTLVAKAGLPSSKAGDMLKEEIQAFAKGGAVASGAIALKNTMGLPEWAGLAVTGFGAPAAYVAGKQIKDIVKNKWMFDFSNLKLPGFGFKQSFKDEWGNAQREALSKFENGAFSKEQYEAIKPFLDVAAEHNIPVNLGAFTDSQALRSAEHLAAQNNLTGEARLKFFQEQADAWANSVKQLTDRISISHRFSQQGEVAEALFSEVTSKKFEANKAEYIKLYDEAAKLLANTDYLSAEDVKLLEDSLNRIMEKLSGSLTPTTAEQAAKSVAERAKAALKVSPKEAGRPVLEELTLPTGKGLEELTVQQAGQEVGERMGQTALMRGEAKALKAQERSAETLKESQKKLEKLVGKENAKNMTIDPDTGRIKINRKINGKNMSDTVRSLNSYIEWDNPEVRNLMKGYLDTTKMIMGRKYGKTAGYQKYLQANQKFSQNAKIFGENAPFNKWKIRSNTTTEELLRTIKTPTRFKQFEKEFGGTKEGQELIAELKRVKVSEMLEPVFHNWSPGKVNTGLSKLLKNPEFNYYLPKEVRNDLKTLRDLDRRIEFTSKPIYDKSMKPEKMEGLGAIDWALGILSPTALIEKMLLKSGAKAVSARQTQAFADVLFDPNITHKMVDLGKRVESGLHTPKPHSYWQSLKADAQAFEDSLMQNAKTLSAAYTADEMDQKR